MKASDIKKLLGKTVTFKSNRTTWSHICPTATGEIKEQFRGEVYIAGDWHNIKTIEILKVHPDGDV